MTLIVKPCEERTWLLRNKCPDMLLRMSPDKTQLKAIIPFFEDFSKFIFNFFTIYFEN